MSMPFTIWNYTNNLNDLGCNNKTLQMLLHGFGTFKCLISIFVFCFPKILLKDFCIKYNGGKNNKGYTLKGKKLSLFWTLFCFDILTRHKTIKSWLSLNSAERYTMRILFDKCFLVLEISVSCQKYNISWNYLSYSISCQGV